MYFKSTLCGIVLTLLAIVSGEGSDCTNTGGECKELQYCPDIFTRLTAIDFSAIPFCNKLLGIVCCPQQNIVLDTRIGSSEPITFAEKACFEYQKLAPPSCPQALVYGGEKAAPKEFQSIALLGFKNKNSGKIDWVCGGTLISKSFVVTAAHCWLRSINFVRLGELDYSTTTDATQSQDFNVHNAIVHPTYKLERYNDIALVELDRDATLNEYVLPACLPSKNTAYKTFTAVGWGETEKKSPSPHLLKVQLDLFAGENCTGSETAQSELEWGLREHTQICVGSNQDGIDTCNGDSGGPLYVPHPTYRCMLELAAITSFGYVNCGTANIPSINTKVNLYLDWIENVVWNATAPF